MMRVCLMDYLLMNGLVRNWSVEGNNVRKLVNLE